MRLGPGLSPVIPRIRALGNLRGPAPRLAYPLHGRRLRLPTPATPAQRAPTLALAHTVVVFHRGRDALLRVSPTQRQPPPPLLLRPPVSRLGRGHPPHRRSAPRAGGGPWPWTPLRPRLLAPGGRGQGSAPPPAGPQPLATARGGVARRHRPGDKGDRGGEVPRSGASPSRQRPRDPQSSRPVRWRRRSAPLAPPLPRRATFRGSAYRLLPVKQAGDIARLPSQAVARGWLAWLGAAVGGPTSTDSDQEADDCRYNRCEQAPPHLPSRVTPKRRAGTTESFYACLNLTIDFYLQAGHGGSLQAAISMQYIYVPGIVFARGPALLC
ncbi:translation initiation factor IF-2-like isoform X3 [Panicum virgatum]|uniref:translation initiation factor IF-2-like isoform X3 n=1 Tax=Panicum virgatum TaxID=38727 RepID=UPI0019D5B667|nr:translation initiation factor IF-2-like isoform X3 [Panicum virgatum]